MTDIDPQVRNRLLMLTGMWREFSDDPLPRLAPGDVTEQLRSFEEQVVDMVFREATPETARRAANVTWDLVHDRPDSDPVKQRVIAGHEELARMTHGREQ
jgi:hypothetical protein